MADQGSVALLAPKLYNSTHYTEVFGHPPGRETTRAEKDRRDVICAQIDQLETAVNSTDIAARTTALRIISEYPTVPVLHVAPDGRLSTRAFSDDPVENATKWLSIQIYRDIQVHTQEEWDPLSRLFKCRRSFELPANGIEFETARRRIDAHLPFFIAVRQYLRIGVQRILDDLSIVTETIVQTESDVTVALFTGKVCDSSPSPKLGVADRNKTQLAALSSKPNTVVMLEDSPIMIRLQMLYRREKRLDDELQRWHAQADMLDREDAGVRAVARQLERWSQNQ